MLPQKLMGGDAVWQGAPLESRPLGAVRKRSFLSSVGILRPAIVQGEAHEYSILSATVFCGIVILTQAVFRKT
ncbi:hypothetical protein Misp06_03829 [Microbulbifer sp. NBRC 101763]